MPTTRRHFLCLAAATTATAVTTAATSHPLLAQTSAAGALEERLSIDPMRPQYHLLPARNWMNDPNGPIYFKGNYHMFFQYDPLAAVWGDMSWGHAISKDMLHWNHLPVALSPTPGGPDSFGCFSGSAIAVGERVYVVYTGTRKSANDLATIRDGTNNIQESQCLAWSDDPELLRWEKDPQPILARPPIGMNITGFRDPSAWRHGEWFYMTVGSGVENLGGCVLLYRSQADPASAALKSWQYLHKLTSGVWDGTKTPNPCDDGEMWECPDLFPLGNAHVLIYSTLGKVFWESGALDPTTMRFSSKQKGELDWGSFYAPKTQLDAQGQRILWGWIPEKRSDAQMRAAGWSGMMSLPRVLTLDDDGTLKINDLPQLSSLRAGPLETVHSGDRTSLTLPRANGELLCTSQPGNDLQLTLSNGGAQLIDVQYIAATHAFVADGKQIVLQPGAVPGIHAFVDGSVIEINLGQRVGYTKRFYYTQATAPDIDVAIKASGPITVHAWSVHATSKDRLTSST